MPSARTRLLLVGAGHANLEVLRRVVLERPVELQVTIVSLEVRQFYSGMTPGFLAGHYSLEDISTDVPAIAGRAGADCVIGCATRLDAGRRTVTLQDGRVLEYDLLSLNIGSLLLGADGARVRNAQRIKPLQRAAELKERLEHVAQTDGAQPAAIIVVGAGAGGVEVACAAAAVMDRTGRARQVTLVDRGDHVPAGYGAWFRRRAAHALDRRGIRRRVNVGARSVDEHGVTLDDGSVLRSDLTVWLTGPEGAPFLAQSGLPVDARGFLWTDDFLRSIADPRIFAVGDCGTPRAYPSLAKSGVHAVREAPILWRNLLAAARGERPIPFRPQRHFLSILNTADGRALLHYRGVVSWSRWAWRLKDWIDRGFMRKYQALVE